MPSTFLSILAYEMRPEGVRARVEDSADSMKHHSLTEADMGKRGRAHRRSRIPRFLRLSNTLFSAPTPTNPVAEISPLGRTAGSCLLTNRASRPRPTEVSPLGRSRRVRLRASERVQP